ncbi:trichohyalin [Oncorhynchus kisutch]|uniref:trichohyalin n=1 Tax=Oncorhynchus kisutch TaxID=8019 RepID=UPI0012DD33BA|nr:trichohyalin-like [Oncorhynchus kisutch]
MMASGAGKAPQPPGPGSGSLNGTAADLPNIEQELYDYQMHGKMCKKIAQLTKVIYSLNTKNEEQEAALQAVSHAHQEELRRVTTGTCTEGEESVVLRTRLSELQETLAQVQVDFESYRVQAEERDRGVEAELRRDYEEKLQVLGLERQETQAQLNTAHDESLRLGRELETAGEAAQCLEVQCDELRRKGEERGKGKEKEMERMRLLSEEVKTLRKGKERAEEEREREVTEEKEELKRSMEEARREERRQWEEREEEEKRGMSTVLRERVRKAEGEMEGSLQRLNESKRHAAKLQDRIQDLEEELESGRRRVSGAEGGAKRAWEELVVAKERLLLQEEELQSKSEELLSRGVCEGCVCVNVEELKGQVNKLQSRNRELELQSSGRNNDYARQHAEALASLRSEMVRAQEEERERLQKEREEERERLQKEIEEVKGRVTTQMEGNTELVEEQRESLNQEKKRLKEQADEERRRLKEQVKKAIEEVMRKHAAELHNAQEALRTNQEVCVRVQEDRRSGEEVCRRLETEREELRDQLQQATNQIWRLEGVIQQQSQGGVASETPPTCGIHCSHLREDLQHIQEEMDRQRESYQREMTGLRTDKQRLEEKVLELNQQTQENTDRNVLEHNQENTDRNVLEHNQENTDRNVPEHNQENTERNVPEHNQENTDERIRSECEERLRAELKAELDAAVATSNQREQELQTQLADLQSQVERKAGPIEGDHDDSEIDRLRREVQETRDMNQRLREQLKEEPQRHTAALQALERRAQEELQTERNRLHTLHLLQLDKQGTELSQQYTEWSRQLTQRHMKHIEDLQTELHTHTEMMALQQDLKQQNQYQVFERQLDESRCAVLELQRENTVLRSGEEAMGREREQKEREEEAQRLRVEVDRLREEVEKLEEAQKQREEQREEEMREEEARREMEEKRRDEEKRTEEENRREEVKRIEAEVEEKRKVDEEKRRKAEEEEKRRKEEEEEERREEVKREHRRAMQSLVCEYSSCQAELQTRIVALETELREREERCRRREVPLCDDLQMGRLQERLTERNQLIKRLVEERHQLQLHPPVAGDNGTLRLHDNRPHPGIVTPTMRRKRVEESPPRVTSVPNLSAYERSVLLPHDTPSPCLPQHPSPSSSLPRSSLPRTPRSPSLDPSGRGPLSRTPTPLPPAPTTPLPLCPSSLPEPRHGIRHVTSPSQELRPHLNSQSTRSPYLEQRGSGQGAEGRDPQRQDWYTKYFSF